MAPNVTLHFFAANEINGDVLLEVTDEDEYFKGLQLKPDLYSLGGGEVTLARRVGFALLSGSAVAPESFVRVLVHAYSDTSYYYGFFLDKREQVVVDPDEDGGEEFHLGGPGPKFYLDRSVLGIVDHLGAGWHLDLENGVWRWKETANAGQILNRILNEDAARTDPALPDLTTSFTGGLDSNGDAWAVDIAGSDQFELPIGRSYLQILFDLEDASGLLSTVNLGTVATPKYELEGWNSYGDDVTATSFAAGKVILREGVNIGDTELRLEARSLRKANRAIVAGKDGAYEYVELPGWSPGDYVKYAYIDWPNSSSETILHQVGLRWLRRQENADKELTVPIVPGASEGTGFYFPKPSGPLWLGNTITVDTAADGTNPTSIDLDNEDELVTGFELELGPAGDTASADKKAKSWNVKVKLNVERGGNPSHPDQQTVGGGTCKCLKLCTAGEEVFDLETSTAWKRTALDTVPAGWEDVGFDDSAYSTAVSVSNGAWDDSPSSRWIWGTANSEGIVGFRREFTLDEQPLSGVLSLAADGLCDVYINGTLVKHHVGYATIVDYDIAPSPFVVGANCIAIIGENPNAGDPNPGGVYAILQLSTEATAVTGSEGRAARCDHKHLIEDLLTAETDTGLRLAPDGAGGVEWAAGGGSYGNEEAQDAVGGILVDSSTVDFTYADATPSITAVVLPGGIKLDDLGAPDDNTDRNASSSAHGLLPKLDNTGLKFLRDDGTWQPLTSVTVTALGYQAYAYPHGISFAHGSGTYSTVTLPANGGCRACPVEITAPLLVDSFIFRATNTATARSVQIDLYYQDSQTSAVCTRVASGALSFTPGAAAFRAVQVGSAPVLVAPGFYWLVVQCTHATNSLDIGVLAGGWGNNVAQSKTTSNPNGSTLDMSTGWTRLTSQLAVMIQGRVFNEGALF